MNAKEMFEGLGFYLGDSAQNRILYVKSKSMFGYDVRIVFFHNEYDAHKSHYRISSKLLWKLHRIWFKENVELHLAIHQQMKELGWLE